MAVSGNAPGPGHTADPREILALAEEFAMAAERLLKLRRKGKPLSQAPFRLAAIHAIELYLNAVLLADGTSPDQLPSFQHDLSKRLASAKALKLDRRTTTHVETLTNTKEYREARYAPRQSAKLSPLTRLHRTLEVIRREARAIIDQHEGPAYTRRTENG